MSNDPCDVLIAGAGPAGSTLALRLARAGLHVRLVEARRFPRFKPCGEFMSPQCVPILRELGVEHTLDALGVRHVKGMWLEGFGRAAHGRFAPVGKATPPSEHGYAVRREVFDGVLLDAALREPLVEYQDGVRVVGVVRDRRGAVRGARVRTHDEAETEIEARFTVGADGLRSRIASSLGVVRPIPWLEKLALVTRYRGVSALDCGEVHFFERGYFAATSVDAGLFSVNLTIDLAAYRRFGSRAVDVFDRAVEACAPMQARLAGAERCDPVRGIGPIALATSRQAFDGCALVGDAAGYVDPVTGEGIFFALRGAELLAESLVRALKQGRTDARALDGYVAARKREIASRLFLARALQRGLRQDWLVRAALASMQARPGLADLAVSVAGDYVPPSELAHAAVWLDALRSSTLGTSSPSGDTVRR